MDRSMQLTTNRNEIDINDEMETKEKKQLAEMESLRDPLTKVWNRKAFEKVIEKEKSIEKPIALAVVDVDNFKIFNDTLGHEAGNQVLRNAANSVNGVLRAEDDVFRMGGDEFYILIRNCTNNFWTAICGKQQKIHSELENLFQEMPVTFSIGIAFSENGYHEDLPKLADEMLYEVKHRGRAGCAAINRGSGKKQFWKDIRISGRLQNIMAFNNTGVFRIEYPEDEKKSPGFICGDILREVFSFPEQASPEECYQIWVSGIEPSYRKIMDEGRKTVANGQQVECTYRWKHRSYGNILIRLTGKKEIQDGVLTFRGYQHSLQSTKILENKDDRQLMFDSMHSIYFCSYYIDLDHDAFSIMKNAPGEKRMEMNKDKATDTVRQFLRTLVSEDDKGKMSTFMDLSTVRERMEHEQHLDCEYRSLSDKDWCRATLFPVKYDENGKLTHVLFAVTSLDADNAKEVKSGQENRKSIENLYNNIPGGIAMFEWDGATLKTIYVSDYFERENGSITNGTTAGQGQVILNQVHPEDVEDYRNAVGKALQTGEDFHYEFRRWKDAKMAYSWMSIDAKGSKQPDGKLLVYALFTNITERKEIELALAKKQASFEASLKAVEQICCEYDPKTHVLECLEEDNFLNLPKKVVNYPDCMQDMEFIHPQDMERFLKTVHVIDGSRIERCTIRGLRNGEYRWFSLVFSPYYDQEKERNIAILTMQDITHQMDAVHLYQDRLRGLLSTKENVLNMCLINITKDSCEFKKNDDRYKDLAKEAESIDSIVFAGARNIVGEDAQKKYCELFCRENLLKQASKGKMHVEMEYLIRIDTNHYEWMHSDVKLVQNPVTEDIIGVAYNYIAHETKLKESLVKMIVKQDYILATIVIKDTDEFYLYDSSSCKFGESRGDFWTKSLRDFNHRCTQDTIDDLRRLLTKENVIKNLETNTVYKFAFNGKYSEKNDRVEVRFSYVDDSHTMFLVTIRNVTDISLLNQFKYDSEHDFLTGLYNRKTVFRKSRELLDMYPNEGFVIIHADLRHFRLYNTFFGEEAGDQLLCYVADLLRSMSPDYDHWIYGRIDSDVFYACFPYEEQRYLKHIVKMIDRLKNYRKDFLIEVTIGMYVVTDRSLPVDAMFARATLAAKSVQNSTPYATVIYDKSMEQKLAEQQQIINDMQKAIDEEQFQVYLQPKYSLRTNKPVGAEALVRWIHPTKGLVSPGLFIPVFERNGFITTLDRYMWEHVCILQKKWKDEGKPLFPISVNMSRLSTYSIGTVKYLKDLVKKYDIDPKYLELELTESAYMDEPEEMKKLMKLLKEAGFTILLDDFGSGYSSLNTLRELPVDVLKLDMKFLSMDEKDIRGGIVISSIVRMSKLLNLIVIAEGVETQEQADFLKEIGCGYVQGFLFAHPMPVKEYETLILHREEALTHVNQPVMDHIGKIMAETGTVTYAMGRVLPLPLAYLEYTKGSYTFLRVNPKFYEEFGLEEVLDPVSKMFKSHITQDSYLAFIQTMEKICETEQVLQTEIVWNTEDGLQRKYICTISYEGNVGDTKVIIIAFTNMITCKR